ncbi:MAG: bifunctional (p)ppGpp synthetase/guanosine-3',5'-bis(diphosphate) 3'-pyrophosphohydrolase [Spirochaetales bacterium]|nr:bifunctional (p)ppGpp synthetase/guanosine-3',5'-bis(diphosphate) 3'-pyrophosphohydrolase [Spirochaetales bacterium]
METRLKKFEEKLRIYSPAARDRIMEAAEWAKSLHSLQNRASGEPFFIHPLMVAELLIDMQMDEETIIAALLHDVLEDTDTSEAELRRRFGKTVETLVNGVTKISIFKAKSKSIQESETIRKMLVAGTRDIRVLLIKLADKYHNMSTLEHLPPDKQKAIASECLEIYAPLAERLGISWLKVGLENNALRILQPSVYSHISETVAEIRHNHRSYLKRVEKAILKEAAKESMHIEVSTRAKHIYSIHQKMKIRKKDLHEIFDVLGIRIICDTINDCYSLLGVVHRLWPPIDGRFKDYIAMPKSNQYQSLHTSVMCYEGKIMEIQIRTRPMHERAEYGIAAHWAYKTKSTKQKAEDELALIDKLRQWDKDTAQSPDFMNEIKEEILKDSIYVFTPKGHIVELAKGATALDFAYHIHTEVGNHCMGAKADGAIVPLGKPLGNTQVIEILTSGTATPHLNWLKLAQTSKARQKIRHWLNKHDENVIIEKSIIAKKKPDLPEGDGASKEAGEPDEIVKQVIDEAKIVFKIGNEKNMLISIAHCCNPVNGDAIIGYVSRGRGIIVHRQDCSNLRNINEFENRKIDVEWETSSKVSTHRFQVKSKRVSDLFSEIEGAVRKYRGHLIEGRLEENETGFLTGSFTLEIEKSEDYKSILKSIRTIPSVLNITSI